MSWGGGEFSGENAYDSAYFDQPGVAFVASSGDSGAPASWPATSPNVLSVGGTALSVDASNAWSSEVGWSGSGGGPSAYESQPSY
jgi:subtilase family serine protease